MKKYTVIVILVCYPLYSQTFEWAKQIGGEGMSNVTLKDLVVTEASGIFITGSFSGLVDFDPSEVAHYKTAIGVDGFAAHYNPDGNLIWVYTTNTAGTEEISAATYSQPNILNMAVKTSNSTFNMCALNGDDGSVYAISPTYETVFGFVTINAINKTFANGETAFYIVGEITGDLTIGSHVLECIGYTDAFCAKFAVSPLEWFSVVWAKRFGGQFNTSFRDVVVNGQNTNPVIVGDFEGTIDFGLGSIHASAGYSDGLIITLDGANGSLAAPNAAFTFGSITDDTAASIFRSDAASSPVLVGGKFSNTADFNPTSETTSLTSSGGFDGFLAYFDAAFEPADFNYTLRWAKNIGGSFMDEVVGVTYNTDVFYSARFQSSFFGTSIHLGGFDSNGNTTSFGGQFISNSQNSQNYVTGFEMNTGGDIYSAGFFGDTTDFDPGTEITMLHPVGMAFNGFIQKMSGNSLGTNHAIIPDFSIYPNPALNEIMMTSGQNIPISATLFDATGKSIKHSNFETGGTMDISAFPSGFYWLKIVSPSGITTKKIIKK